MTWVKVCGLREPADVEAAVEAGANAIGLVLAPSPRQVSVELAARLVRVADRQVETILVTVDRSPQDLQFALEATGASGVQPYGRFADASTDLAARLGVFILHPLWSTERARFDTIPPDQIPLVDSPSDELHGGTGRPFAWDALDGIERDFVLAGGLGPHNIGEAIGLVAPWGVDASSHLESRPGVKDRDAIKAFVRGAHRQ